MMSSCNMTTIHVTHYGDGEINIEAPMQAEKKVEVSPEVKFGLAQ